MRNALKRFILVFVVVFSIPVHAYFFVIPVKISPSNGLPFASVQIENENCLLMVDLGSKLLLSLREDILEKLDKIPYGTAKWKNGLGQDYEAPAIIITKIALGDMYLSNVIVNEERESLCLYTSSKEFKGICDGTIGHSLLSKFNLLLDFSHSLILATDQNCTLGLIGYQLDKLVKLPFKHTRGEIIFSVETDIGMKRFFLDTGCSYSIINSQQLLDVKLDNMRYDLPIYTTSKFCIGDHDFGMTDLSAVSICDFSNIDGVLGMDFLKSHIVYIDFDQQYIYIEP